jgi:hypothetical protein
VPDVRNRTGALIDAHERASAEVRPDDAPHAANVSIITLAVMYLFIGAVYRT